MNAKKPNVNRLARVAAVTTLVRMGYVHRGGEEWAPPEGKAPAFALLDLQRREIDRLKQCLFQAQEAAKDLAGKLSATDNPAASHWHALYRDAIQQKHDECARLGAQVQALEAWKIDATNGLVAAEEALNSLEPAQVEGAIFLVNVALQGAA